MTIKPGTIIGYRKSGMPIRLIAGGSESAPEPTPSVPNPPAGIPLQQSFTREQLQAEIDRARKETEDRFASQLSGLTTQFTGAQEQLAALQAERAERQTAAQAEADRIAAEQRAAEEEKLSLKDLMAKRERETAERFSQLEAELSRRDALLEKERQYAELERYKMSRIAEMQEPNQETGHPGIDPRLVDLIAGSTREAIDASINTMVAKTGAILNDVRQAQMASRAAIPGVSPTAGNIGVMDQQDQTRNYSAEDIHALPPGSEEHMRLRAAYGMGGASNRGMFG